MSKLELLAKRHQDWMNMAISFGLSKEDAEDLVQDMYIKMYKFAAAEKMKYSDNDVNTFYVYVTLRNLFYDQKKKQVPQVDINSLTNLAYEECEYDKEALEDLLENMSQCIEDMHWYNKKIFEIYYGKGKTIRELSDESKISSNAIFNTLKNVREEIKIKCKKDYQDYTKQED